VYKLPNHRHIEKVEREPEIDPASLVQLFKMVSAELESGAFNICVQLIESARSNNWDYRVSRYR
jgi:hypothetical protein